MSTIWEMAAIVRAEEEQARAAAGRPEPHRSRVTIDVPAERAYWCKVFGTTPMNLCCAIESVGSEPSALRRFFESRTRLPVRAGHGRA